MTPYVVHPSPRWFFLFPLWAVICQKMLDIICSCGLALSETLSCSMAWCGCGEIGEIWGAGGAPSSPLIVLCCIIVCNNQLFTWPSTTSQSTLQPLLSWKSLAPLQRPVSKAQYQTEHVNGFSTGWWVICEGCGTQKAVLVLPPDFEEL